MGASEKLMNLFEIEKSITLLSDFLNRVKDVLKPYDFTHLYDIKLILSNVFKELIFSRELTSIEVLEPKELKEKFIPIIESLQKRVRDLTKNE